MKTVIKKEPDTFKAAQWTGMNRDDYKEFIKELEWTDEHEIEYSDNKNSLLITIEYDFDYERQVEVPEMSWIVFDYELEVLSNFEFHKKYKVLPLK